MYEHVRNATGTVPNTLERRSPLPTKHAAGSVGTVHHEQRSLHWGACSDAGHPRRVHTSAPR